MEQACHSKKPVWVQRPFVAGEGKNPGNYSIELKQNLAEIYLQVSGLKKQDILCKNE
jgi:hypothetical protein